MSHIGRAQHVTRAGNHFKIVMLSGWYSTDSLLHIPVWYGVMREREVLLVLLMSVSWRETTALTCWSSDRTNLTMCQLEKNNQAGSTVRWIFFCYFSSSISSLLYSSTEFKRFSFIKLEYRWQRQKWCPVLKTRELEMYLSTEFEMFSCTQPPSTEINCCLQPRWGQICYSNQPPGPLLLTVWRGWNLLLSSSVISHLASNE